MIEPFELTLYNVNLVEDEEEGKLVIGWLAADVRGKLRPGMIIRISVDSDGDVSEITPIDESEVEGYIFRANQHLLPSSLSGQVLVWNSCYESVVVVLKRPLPDMTFDE